MKIRNLAASNIKHNMKNYTMYFFAMCFCVFTTYSFANLALSESVAEKIYYSINYKNMFIGFGVAIIVFVLFFLISSNNSFIRYRKKEISTYALFGMENRKIGQLLFFETISIGLVALIIGILLGIFFSKLMSMILLKMMLADYADVSFSIEPKSLIITSVVYLIIFCLMGLSGQRTINKFQLVDLFKGDRVSEKRTTGSYIMLIVSVLLIGYGYSLAIADDTYTVAKNMLSVIGMVVLGTYLFFVGGLQKILHLIKKNKGFLYNKSRLISVSLLSHKARTFATTMGTIAVLIATSVTAMAFGYTLYQSAESNAKEINSFDIWYYADNEGLENEIYSMLEKHGSEPVNTVKFQRYVSFPKGANMPEGNMWFEYDDTSVMTYSESVFNEIVKAAQDSNPYIETTEGTALLLYPDYYTEFQYDKPTLSFGNNIYPVDFVQVSNPYNFGTVLTVVLHDNDYNKLYEQGYITKGGEGHNEYWPFVGINYKNSLTSRVLAKDLTNLMKASDNVGMHRIMYNSYIEGMEIFGLICFIGYFICAVFILMSVSLLYFKQVAIGTEEISQYERLRKIGMDKEQESRVVRNRIAPVFFIPLLMGLIHSVFAMKGADSMIFSNMIITEGSSYLQVLKTSAVMYLIYSVIYLAFYFITKYKYVRVVTNK